MINSTLDLARLRTHNEQIQQLGQRKGSTRAKRPAQRKAALPALFASQHTDEPGEPDALTAVAALMSPAPLTPPVQLMPQDLCHLGMLRCPQVLALTGWSRSTLYNRIAESAFPPGVPLGPRTVGWPAAEVYAYLAARINERNARAQRQLPDPTAEASA